MVFLPCFRDKLSFDIMKQYLLETEDLVLKSYMEIAGSTCLFSTNSRALFESLHRWTVRRGVGAAHDFEMRVVADRWLIRDAESLPQFRGMQRFVFAVFHGRETFVFDLIERRVTAVVSSETARDREFWDTVFIPIALGVLGPLMGVAPIHAACLASNGQGLLLTGPSGAGKSTLAIALAKEGFALVSDDWTYARVADDEVVAHGLKVPVKLLPESVQFFAELSSLRTKISLNGERAFEVNAAETFHVQVEGQCIPNCVVFLDRWKVEGTSVEAISRDIARDYFLRSAEVLPPQFATAAAERERIIERVASRDCWLFRYGGTPQQGAQALRRFFEERYDVDRICATAS